MVMTTEEQNDLVGAQIPDNQTKDITPKMLRDAFALVTAHNKETNDDIALATSNLGTYAGQTAAAVSTLDTNIKALTTYIQNTGDEAFANLTAILSNDDDIAALLASVDNLEEATPIDLAEINEKFEALETAAATGVSELTYEGGNTAYDCILPVGASVSGISYTFRDRRNFPLRTTFITLSATDIQNAVVENATSSLIVREVELDGVDYVSYVRIINNGEYLLVRFLGQHSNIYNTYESVEDVVINIIEKKQGSAVQMVSMANLIAELTAKVEGYEALQPIEDVTQLNMLLAMQKEIDSLKVAAKVTAPSVADGEPNSPVVEQDPYAPNIPNVIEFPWGQRNSTTITPSEPAVYRVEITSRLNSQALVVTDVQMTIAIGSPALTSVTLITDNKHDEEPTSHTKVIEAIGLEAKAYPVVVSGTNWLNTHISNINHVDENEMTTITLTKLKPLLVPDPNDPRSWAGITGTIEDTGNVDSQGNKIYTMDAYSDAVWQFKVPLGNVEQGKTYKVSHHAGNADSGSGSTMGLDIKADDGNEYMEIAIQADSEGNVTIDGDNETSELIGDIWYHTFTADHSGQLLYSVYGQNSATERTLSAIKLVEVI